MNAVIARLPKIIFGAIGAGLVVWLLVGIFGGSPYYTVRAEVNDAGGLLVHSSVKVGGVIAGEVTNLQVTPRTTVIVTMSINKDAAPIGTGATVAVRPTDLLGEHYADLNPGNLDHPLPSGTFIPLSRTSEPVELDDVLNMLQPSVRTALGLLVNEAGVGLMGQHVNLGSLLRSMPPSLQAGETLLTQINQENATLGSLIHQGAAVTTVISTKRDQLGQLVGQAERSLGVVAARHAQLSGTVAAAQPALAELTTTLGSLRGAAADLAPTADEIRATAPILTRTLRELPSFAQAATPTLSAARTVAPSLGDLGQNGTAPLRSVSTTVSTVSHFSGVLKPSLDMINARGMKDLMWFLQNWSLAMQNRDSLEHFLHVILYVDDQELLGTLEDYLKGGQAAFPVSIKHVHSGSSKPATGPSPVTLPAAPKLPPSSTGSGGGTSSGLGATIGKVLAPVTKPLGALTSGVIGGVTRGLNKLGLGGSSGGGAQGSGSSGGSNGLRQLLGYLLGR